MEEVNERMVSGLAEDTRSSDGMLMRSLPYGVTTMAWQSDNTSGSTLFTPKQRHTHKFLPRGSTVFHSVPVKTMDHVLLC